MWIERRKNTVFRVFRELWLCLVVLLLGASAWAQPSSAAEQAAAKFQQGMEQMRARNFERACQLLEQSQTLSSEMATQFRLAECYQEIGRRASAWRSFREIAAQAERAAMADRQRLATERAQALEPDLSKLRLVVADEAKAIPGLRVSLDGQPFAASNWGTAYPVDPGSHSFAASAPGYLPWGQQVEVSKRGETIDIALPVLQPVPKDEPAPAVAALPGPPEPVAPPVSPAPQPPPDDQGSALGTAGIVVGAVGIVAMGAGVGFAVAAKSDYDDAVESHCDEARGFCTQTGLDEQESARAMGNVATAVFVVGGVAAATGLVLWLVAPSDSTDEPEGTAAPASLGVSVSAGGLLATGTF